MHPFVYYYTSMSRCSLHRLKRLSNPIYYSVAYFGEDPIQLGNKCGPLTINVLPVNEFTPVLEPSIQSVNLQEGEPQGGHYFFF